MDLSYHKSLTILINSTPARRLSTWNEIFWYKGVCSYWKFEKKFSSYFIKFGAKIPISIDFVNYFSV
jgi:hypothetical protein